MRVSVITPAFNEEKLIASTLASIRSALAAFTQRGWETEMIVCDNNSTDATARLAREGGAVVVFEPVNQIARARNAGAAAATGDWLIFVDADSRPTEELFADVAEAIARGRCLAGGCTVRLDEREFWADALTGVWNRVSRTLRWAAGSFIFCERAAFQAVDGFNLKMYAGEEIDLSKRLKKLARQRGRTMVILHRHPLVTSARKIHLYSRREWARFMFRAALRPHRTIENRDHCAPWYDGRR